MLKYKTYLFALIITMNVLSTGKPEATGNSLPVDVR